MSISQYYSARLLMTPEPSRRRHSSKRHKNRKADSLPDYDPRRALIIPGGAPTSTPPKTNEPQKANLSAISKTSHLRPQRRKPAHDSAGNENTPKLTVPEVLQLLSALSNQSGSDPTPTHITSPEAQSDTGLETETPHKSIPATSVMKAVPQKTLKGSFLKGIEDQKQWGESHEIRNLEEAQETRFTKKLLLVAAALVVGSLCYGGFSILSGPTSPTDEITSSNNDQPETEPSVEALLAEAETIANGFLRASSKEEILQYVRKPELTKLHLNRHYQDLTLAKLGAPENLKPVTLGEKQGKHYYIFSFTRDLEEAPSLICLVDDSDGFRVDWQAFVGYSEKRWTDIISERPSEQVLLRTTCTLDNYYPHPYNEEEWQCFRLQNPNEAETLFAYAEKGSDLETRLSGMLSSDLNQELKMFTATVRVTCPPNIQGNRVLLAAIIGKGWIN